METIRLIDVIWIEPKAKVITAAFEVEKSTSIYSGILRLEDLARSLPGRNSKFYLVAPNQREHEVMAQFNRPAFKQDLKDISFAYIPFHDMHQYCDAMCKFGEDLSILNKVARTCSCD